MVTRRPRCPPPGCVLFASSNVATRRSFAVFAEGDDGLEFLHDRTGRAWRRALRSGWIRTATVAGIDHPMHRHWQRGPHGDDDRVVARRDTSENADELKRSSSPTSPQGSVRGSALRGSIASLVRCSATGCRVTGAVVGDMVNPAGEANPALSLAWPLCTTRHRTTRWCSPRRLPGSVGSCGWSTGTRPSWDR